MAGTNKQQLNDSVLEAAPLAPVIILVNPQMGENIGMCARAMLNCAATEMRLVKPRDGWPSLSAQTSSAGAISVLENAKVYATTAEAVADLEYVFATTARGRGMVKDIYTPNAAAKVIHEKNAGRTQKCGILFGPERTGLENDDIAMANAIIHIPLNPGFSSLNLAQAVLLTCHAWLSADNPFAGGEIESALGATEPAQKQDIENLMVHLETALEQSDFFRSPDQRPSLMRNIRNFFFRSGATQQDINTMHGIFVSLVGKRKRGG